MRQKKGLLFAIAAEARLEHSVLSGNQVILGRAVLGPFACAVQRGKSVRQTLSDGDTQTRDMKQGLPDRGEAWPRSQLGRQPRVIAPS